MWGIGILPREVFLAIWVGVVFLITLYILGTFEMKLDTAVEKVSGLRAFFAVIFAALGFYFLNGMMGKPLAADLEALLPPDNYEMLISGVAPSGGNTAPEHKAALSMEAKIQQSTGLDHSAWLTDP